ncbi:hypothetical protein [Azospirillum sp. SYSU D00513]|uniref:hypothetical protein n=1 Tax=Azospirillum sp. SYSU D00513 TaxID=2812561 RepID=UPI001A979DBE|nr:hypothetical protein [Azospirillum sp. SYSU D00513]
MRMIPALTLFLAMTALAATPARAGDAFGRSMGNATTGTARPFHPGSESYQLRDGAGRPAGTVRPLHPGSDQMVVRDPAGRVLSPVKPLHPGSDRFVIRDGAGRLTGTLDRR